MKILNIVLDGLNTICFCHSVFETAMVVDRTLFLEPNSVLVYVMCLGIIAIATHIMKWK